MLNVKKMEDSKNIGVAVYDISLDGTVVNALGETDCKADNGYLVMSNTDG